jgi:hypothetical protein
MRIEDEPPFPPPKQAPEDGENGWRLVRMWLLASAWGIGSATVFTLALLWLDVGHLGTLLARDGSLAPLLMLWGPFAVLFGAVDFGRRVMAIGREDGDT